MSVFFVFRWIILLLLTLSFQGVVFCEVAWGQPNLESFKKFLHNPPPLHKVIAEVCVADSAKTNNELNCFYVLIRSQTNGFFYREVPRLDDLYTTNVYPGFRCAGSYGEAFWNFGIDGLVLDYSTNRQESLVQTLAHVNAKASKVLNLGIFDLLPGSITWNGNSILPVTNHAGVQLQGGLSFVEGQQLPVGFRLMTDYQGYGVPWELKYEYSRTKAVPAFLPTTIVGESVREGRRSLQFEVHYLEVVLGDDLLSQDFFNPNALLGRVPYQILSADGVKFSRDKLNKAFKPLSASNNQQAGGTGWVRVVVILCLLLLFPLFYLINRRGA